MKKLLTYTAVLALVFGATFLPQAQEVKAECVALLKAAFEWDNTSIDLGKIEQGVPTTAEFTFTNEGSEPLVISNVKGSCGCTVTDYTKEPIAPGEEGVVKGTYNAAKMGSFLKTITVTANTDGGPVKLTLKGEVVAKEQ